MKPLIREEVKPFTHWAHIVTVPKTADIASVQSISAVADRFSRAVNSKTETADTVFVMSVFRDAADKFSVDWWYFRNHQGWFEFDADGTPTLHLQPNYDGKGKVPDESVLEFRKLADPPADSGAKFHVWILKEADPFCAQPQRHQPYSQVEWWKVFLRPDDEHYKFVLGDPPKLEGPIVEPKWDPKEADLLWEKNRMGKRAYSEPPAPAVPSTDEGGK